jgi:hypothetical protein
MTNSLVEEALFEKMGIQPKFSATELREAMRDPHLADWQHQKIMEQIAEYEESLDDNTEVMVMLASFGKSVLMAVTDIGYQNPDLIYFYGSVNGKPAQLIQHVNQISFLLTSAPKCDPTQPPRRIGFVQPAE